MLQTTIYMYHNNTRDEEKNPPKKWEMTEMRPPPLPALRSAGRQLNDNLPPSKGHNMHDKRCYEDRSMIWVGTEWWGRFCFVFSSNKVVKINVFLHLNMLEIPPK